MARLSFHSVVLDLFHMLRNHMHCLKIKYICLYSIQHRRMAMGFYMQTKRMKKKTNREGHKNKTIWQTEKAKEEGKKKSERKTKLEHVFRTRRIMHSVCKRHKYFRMLPNWMDSDNRNYFNSFRFIRSIFGRLFRYIFVVIHKFSQRVEYGICNQTKRSAKPTETSIRIHVKFILIDFWKRIDHTISKYSTCFCFSPPCIAM